MEHRHRFGRLDDAAVLGDNADPVFRNVEQSGELLEKLVAAEDANGDGVFAAAGDDGEERFIIGGADVELVGVEVDFVADFVLGLLPETGGLEHHLGVVVLRVGGAEGAGLAVGGAAVVEEVELLEEKRFEAAFRCLVGGGATHDAGSDDYYVKQKLHWFCFVCVCVSYPVIVDDLNQKPPQYVWIYLLLV